MQRHMNLMLAEIYLSFSANQSSDSKGGGATDPSYYYLNIC